MVDEHSSGCGIGGDRFAQILQSRQRVEVEAMNLIGFSDGMGGTACLVGAEDDNLVDTPHPVEEVGVFVRDDAGDGVAQRPQHGGPSERRTDGIAVGIGVRYDDDALLRTGEQLVQGIDLRRLKIHSSEFCVGY